MSIVSKAQLKNEFADGQIITESTMDNLIDSTYNPNLVAGTNITLVPSGNDITINSTGGGGAGTLQDVLTAGSIGTVPTLIDIRSTGANNFFIEAGNDLNLWGQNDVIINGAGGDTTVGAQDNVFITTAAVLGIISLSSGDINLTANANTNIGAENNINLSTVVDDIIINSAQNVDIDAGQLLTIDAVNDVEIQSTTSNVDIQAQGQVNIDSVTADISLLTHATNINLESARDIILDADRDVIIPKLDTGSTPSAGDLLAAKDITGALEWVPAGAGNSQSIVGIAMNPGDYDTTNIKQVIFGDPTSSVVNNAGCWLIPFDIKITQIQVKWVGVIAPIIDGGSTGTEEELTWDIGILTDRNGTSDTTDTVASPPEPGQVNFTSATGGGGLPDISIDSAESGTFWYKTWNGNIDLDQGEILVMWHKLSVADWSEVSMEALVVITFHER